MKELVAHVVSDIVENGGAPYIVGGFVRDHLLSKIKGVEIESKDLDIEVYGIESEKLETILSRHGEVVECGKSFGVFKLKIGEAVFDFSLPRTDSKVGEGHKGFVVSTNPRMTTFEGARRRNFTINSAMIKLPEEEIIDHYDASQDIRDNSISPVHPATYTEDPLRNLIGLQQCCRFGLTPRLRDIPTYEKAMRDFSSLSSERIWGEWEKLFSKGIFFKKFFLNLAIFSFSKEYPEISALIGLEQDPEWHPEGSVDIHSALAAEWTVDYCIRNRITGERRIVLVAATLLHDIGKPLCTAKDDDGKIRSRAHDSLAIENNGSPGPLITFLNRIHMPKHLQDRIIPLVKEHMIHVGGSLEKRTVRRLANRIFPATVSDLDVLIQADHAARPPLSADHPCPQLMKFAAELSVEAEKPKPIILGRHLISKGIQPGPEMGEILRRAFELQLDGSFETVEGGLECLGL